MLRPHRSALLWAVTWAVGCSSCDDTPAVPFKLSTARRGSFATTGDGGTETLPKLTATPGSLRAGSSYGADTTRIELDGRVLALAPGSGAIRAALELPRSGNDESGLLLVTQDAEGRPALQLARGQAGAWGAPQRVAELAAAGACTLREGRLELLDAGFALAKADLDCPALPAPGASAPPGTPGVAAPNPGRATPPAAVASGTGPRVAPTAPDPGQAAQPSAGPPPPDPPAPPGTPEPTSAAPTAAAAAPPTQAERHLWAVALEGAPRVLEHFAAPLLGQEAPGLRVEPALVSRDLDADGHADLALALDVRGGGQPDTRIEIALLSRAGGLAQDATEPEKTLLALADQAKTDRRGNPKRAAELASRVLALHGALCRESGSALVRVGGVQGLPCGASLAAGRAASVQTALLAGQGKLLEALELHDRLQSPAYRLTDNDRERVRVALEARSDAQGYEFRPGPALATGAAPSVRRSAIAFLDEQRLLLRGSPAQSYDVASGALAPIGMPGDLLLSDPSGRYAISGLYRSCEGYHLSIVEATRIVAGMVTGPSVSEPLFAPAPPPQAARCPELTREQRRDTGGFRVLGWTAKGVLIGHGPSLRLLALDASARAAAPASELAAGAAVPAQSHSAELSADGRYHALITPLGIAIHDLKQGGSRLVPVPDGTQAVTDVALSPSGQRLAIVRGGRVLLGLPRAPGAAAPPTAAQTTAAPKP